MGDSLEKIPNTRGMPGRWRDSLITRVILLCSVLLLCLLASVYVITRHFYREVSEEMARQTRAIADSVVLRLDENPELPLDSLEDEVIELHEGFDAIELELLEPLDGEEAVQSFTLEQAADGRLRKVARMSIDYGDRRLLLVASVDVKPQTEILRAFRNRNLSMLTFVFVVILGLMVYLIARTLKPLTELSRRCADISSGTLREVKVHNATREIAALENTFNEMVASLKEKEIVETKLRQSQRLSAIGTLAAGVAHDVRNPLNAIKLLSSHTLDTLRQNGNSDIAEKQLQTIQSEVHRLEEIVSGFLSLAKEGELKPQPRSIDKLLSECVRLVRKDAEARQIRLLEELRAGDTNFQLDAKQWNRALLNVLINALEACPAGGRVRVFSRLTGTHCEIEIRDDGPGLDGESLEHAFDPYYTTKETGTGLGLSITRGIVEEHGGTIALSGGEGEGCQVLISLPLEGQVA